MLLSNKQCIFLLCCGLGQIFTFANADEILYLEIVINGRNTTHIAEVIHKENDWEVSTKELSGLGIKLDIENRERMLLSEIQGTQVVYDSGFQRLLITVPSNLLPMQYFGANIPGANSNAPRRDPGLFINYNAVSISGNSAAKMSSLWHELHFFNNDFFSSIAACGRIATQIFLHPATHGLKLFFSAITKLIYKVLRLAM